MSSDSLLKSVLRSNVIVLALSNLNNLLNYLTQLMLGRNMSAEDYGIFNAVNSLGMMGAAVFMALPFVVTMFIVKHQHNPRIQAELIRQLTLIGLGVSVILGSLWLALSGLLAGYLNLPEAAPVQLLILWLASSIFVSLYTGVLNGFLLYVRSTLQVFTQGMCRFLFSTLAVVGFSLSYNAAIIAGIVANTITVGWMATSIYRIAGAGAGGERERLPEGEMRAMASFALPVVLNWVAIGILTNIDIVMVKHLFDPNEAGLYSVAAVTSRIAFFLPLMLLGVLFPEVARSTQRAESSLSLILLTLGITVMLSGAFALVVAFFPGILITLLFGAKYLPAASYLPIITFAMALVAVINVLFSAFLAKSHFVFLYPSYAVLILTVLLINYRFNGSPQEVASGLLLGCGLLLICNLAVAFFTMGYHKPSAARQ